MDNHCKTFYGLVRRGCFSCKVKWHCVWWCISITVKNHFNSYSKIIRDYFPSDMIILHRSPHHVVVNILNKHCNQFSLFIFIWTGNLTGPFSTTSIMNFSYSQPAIDWWSNSCRSLIFGGWTWTLRLSHYFFFQPEKGSN